MKIQSNRDGSKWINFTKALLLWKVPQTSKVKFVFWKASGVKKIYGLRNCRFRVYRYDKSKAPTFKNLRFLIRCPIFYWHKTNGGWKFGLPNLYLWWHIARC